MFKVQQAVEKAGTCFDTLSMNGFSGVNSVPIPFVLSPSKDSQWFFNGLSRPVMNEVKDLCYLFVTDPSKLRMREAHLELLNP
jgi:hypothetical protein